MRAKILFYSVWDDNLCASHAYTNHRIRDMVMNISIHRVVDRVNKYMSFSFQDGQCVELYGPDLRKVDELCH